MLYLYWHVVYEHTALYFVNGMSHNEFRQVSCACAINILNMHVMHFLHSVTLCKFTVIKIRINNYAFNKTLHLKKYTWLAHILCVQYEPALIINISYYVACSMNVLNSVTTSPCWSFTGFWAKFDTKRRKEKGAGENCIMGSFMICATLIITLGWWNIWD